ncbi:RNA polymerase sigma factor [Butyricimonas paravirosa]
MELTESHIRLLSKGDRKAFRLLYENFFIALCIFARGFHLEREEAEDIVQEVFCKLYDERHLFTNVSSLKSYLYSSIKNGCLNYIRGEKRRKDRESHYYDDVDEERTFFNDIVESEVYRELKMLMDELPPQCRNIFERVLQGATSEEIAEALQLSVETVKTQRKKAKQILRERYNLLYNIFGILF